MQANKKKTLLKIIPWILFCVIAYSLYKSVSQINPHEVMEAFSQITLVTLTIAMSLSILDYAILCTFEFLTFHHLKIKTIPTRKVYYAAFICYTFTLNLGSLVGGLGMRYRLYTKYGVPHKQIPSIIAFSTSTNWLGYIFLLSSTCLLSYEKLAALSPLPTSLILGIGVLGMSLIIGYFVLCTRKNELKIKGYSYPLPKMRTALIQLILASFQWVILTSVLFTIMDGMGLGLPFESILFALLSVSVMAVFIHVPAGLGVLESVFLAFNFNAPPQKILAGLLAFRMVYYLIPLLVAAPLYFLYEFRHRKQAPVTSAL